MKKLTMCGLLCLMALMPPAASGAQPDRSYVALGDSYSSGEGNAPFDGKCHRAARVDSAYPRILPGLIGGIGQPRFHACSGAETEDVWRREQPGRPQQGIQVSYVRETDDLVTITIGGNDLGFKDVLVKCLVRLDCTKHELLARDVPNRLESLRAQLRSLYRRIRGQMDPSGYLVVAGYPRIFAPGPRIGCQLGISRREAEWTNRTVDAANARIAAAVRDARASHGNVVFADVAAAFAGHELCSADEWLYGIQLSSPENGLVLGSYHPKRRGQQAYAATIARSLRDAYRGQGPS